MRDYLHFWREHPRFLSFGLLLTLCSSFGQTYFVSVFKDDFRGATGLSNTGFGSLYSGATLLSGCTILWLGPLIDKADLRRYSTFVALGLVAACLGLSFLPVPAETWTNLAETARPVLLVPTVMLFFSIYGLRLAGQGLLGHTASTSMTRYLSYARGKALGIVSLGYPLGESIFPVAASAWTATDGWRQAWQLVAIGLLLVLVPAIRFLLRGHDERHATHVEKVNAPQSPDAPQQQRQWTVREVRRDLRFWLVLPAALAPPFISTGIFFSVTNLAEAKGWTTQGWLATYIVYAAATVVSSLIGGNLADRISARKMMGFYLIPHGLALIALASGSHWSLVLLYMAGAGLSAGANGSVVGALWPELYGVAHLGAIRATVSSAMVFATSASPILMGYLMDNSVSFESTSIAFCIYTAVASLLCYVALRSSSSAQRA